MTDHPNGNAISFKDVTFTYAAAPMPALSSVTLDVRRGEYVAIMGRNGAGKTTLLLCINGVIPSMLGGEFAGSVVVNDRPADVTAVREMAKSVGMVFDNPEFQMSQTSVAEEVALGLENLGVPYQDMAPAIVEALALVGLSGYEDRSPLALSGGQQQRLAIAATLAMRPNILVMDEPTSNLDPIGKREVFEVSRRLNREQGMTVVVAEHEVEVMADYADRIVVLDEGRVVMNGSPEEVFGSVERLREVGLRPPQATSLGSALRQRDAWSGPLPTTAGVAVAGLVPVILRNRALHA